MEFYNMHEIDLTKKYLFVTLPRGAGRKYHENKKVKK